MEFMLYRQILAIEKKKKPKKTLTQQKPGPTAKFQESKSVKKGQMAQN